MSGHSQHIIIGVKAIQTINSYPDIKENKIWIVSVSSDSFVKVWELDLLQVYFNQFNPFKCIFNCILFQLKNEPKLIASIDTTCRPTCLTVRLIESNTTSDEKNSVQISETEIFDENKNTSVSKKRKNKSNEKFPNKKV